jgi:transposase
MPAREVGMEFPREAWERVMKVQEVILRAMSGEISWIRAADILGASTRSVRRLRFRYEKSGYDGLLDHRKGTPSPRKAPFEEVQRILRLYREKYQGFNGRHFHQIARREHGVKLSYSFVKKALQGAGLLPQHRARGRHRRRREPKACFGEMLHLDGSPHAWLALVPEHRSTLVHVLDDATSRLLYAQLVEAESLQTVMSALREVFETHGLPVAIYTDRAGWAVHTPKAGGPYDAKFPTQLRRALDRLGIEHIVAYSPQARGRSERLNRTVQGRLVNELRLAGITTIEAANAYLRERYLEIHNAQFSHPPLDASSAFVSVGSANLDQYLCREEERTVAKDNTVSMDGVRMQIAKQPGRRSCEGRKVIVRRHLDGTHSIWLGGQAVGRYGAEGLPIASSTQRIRRLGSPPRRVRLLAVAPPAPAKSRRLPNHRKALKARV